VAENNTGSGFAKGCLATSLIVMSIMLGISFLLNLGLVTAFVAKEGISGSTVGEKAEDEFPQFTEKWSYGSGDVKVARIQVSGIISRDKSDGLFNEQMDMTESTLRQIRAAQNDDAVAGILLEVDSPGGTVTSSDEIYMALKKFRASRDDRKVVTFVRDLAASGGLYVSVASDKIIAEPTSIIGSIGVIMQTINIAGLTSKIGVEDVTIKSGDNKDILNPFRPVNTQHIEILQALIDDSYKKFFNIVKEGRNLDETKLRAIADGRVFSSDAALANGLIDQVGYLDDALALIKELVGVPEIKIVRYNTRESFLDWLAEAKNPMPDIKSMYRPEPPRLMYIWRP